MYDAEMFNEKKLFLKFNALTSDPERMNDIFRSREDGEALLMNISQQIDEFLTRASFAHETLLRMKSIMNSVKEEFHQVKNAIKDGLMGTLNQILYESPLVRDYIAQFMPFMNSLFILQDRFMPLIASLTGITYKLPEKKKTRKKFLKDLRKFPTYFHEKDRTLTFFPSSIQEAFLEYWNNNASRVRGFRNLDQHMFGILNNSVFQLRPEEKLVVYLPDDANALEEQVTYNKKVDSYEFLKKAFREFHFFVEKVSRILGYSPKVHSPKTTIPSHVDLQTYPENSALIVSIFQNKSKKYGIIINRGEGYPARIGIQPFDL